MKQSIKRKLDNLWSMAVKLKAGGRCEMCPSIRCLNSHHIFGRRYLALRYDINNGVSLCANCHINMAHQRPTVFTLKIIEIRGKDWHNKLLLKSQQICKHPDELLIEAELKEIIKSYS